MSTAPDPEAALEPPQPQGDVVNDSVAAHNFNRATRDFVLARLRQEWAKRPRSWVTCLRLLWAVWLNFNATLRLWLADAISTRRLVKASSDTDLKTTELGELTCGHIKAGEIATLFVEGGYGWVKVKTADGQIGWAHASDFEYIVKLAKRR